MRNYKYSDLTILKTLPAIYIDIDASGVLKWMEFVMTAYSREVKIVRFGFKISHLSKKSNMIYNCPSNSFLSIFLNRQYFKLNTIKINLPYRMLFE